MDLIQFQADQVERLLSLESVTVIGVLLAICALLIYDRVRKEKDYKELQERFYKDSKEHNDAIVEIASKYQEMNAMVLSQLQMIKDVFTSR
ncbi:hypothetical protein AB832_05550 [Flavobacteriaceae bacterium (ex Bugula neritina AB1)]|nr:hypothetical protein AB832_05550 [Flavobacteriaceae bacterium (ex Bugula neritina AB1)]